MSTSRIASFFRGDGTDDRGRTLEQVLAFSDEELERHHDFIQWLFPTATRSQVNPAAPRVDPSVAAEFRESETLRAAYLRGLHRILAFYGLVLIERDGSISVQTGPDFGAIADRWIYPGSHNFLRLSRILESLRLLGFPDHAVALLAALEQIHELYPDRISDRTVAFWITRATGSES